MSDSQYPEREDALDAREPSAAEPSPWLIFFVLTVVLVAAIVLVVVTHDIAVVGALGTLVVVTVGALYRRRS
jgi:hypothetical protein